MRAQEQYPFLTPISDAQVMQHDQMIGEIEQLRSRVNELDSKLVAILGIVGDTTALIPCYDPAVPWDALTEILKVLR